MRQPPAIHRLGWSWAPLDLAAAWPAEQPLLMLHSGRLHRRWARWSIMASPAARYRFDHDRSRWVGSPARLPQELSDVRFTHDALTDVDAILSATKLNLDALDVPPFPFIGGWIGYFSYDLGRLIEPKAQIHEPAVDDRHWPLIELAYCPGALVYDHANGHWYGVGSDDLTCDELRLTIENAPSPSPQLVNRQSSIVNQFSIGPLRPAIDPDQYMSMVGRTIEYIAAGDIFQANIAQRFSAELAGSPRGLAVAALKHAQPWYGAYLEFPDDAGANPSPEHKIQDRFLLSLSPELFLQTDRRTRRVITRPIKGTRPIAVDPQQLLDSAKDAAELHMIVDLMRNDLGRVCEFGSVRVPNPRRIETHPTVHHGVGEVTGWLHENVTLGDLLGATFPGGSVTGAPKIRAMQIIDELEPQRRGGYCGAIGFISDCGAACLNIAIRTIFISGRGAAGPPRMDHTSGVLDYFAGAGIVADSQPLAEYRECLDKLAIVAKIVAGQLAEIRA